MPITDVLSEPGRFGPLPAEHPAVTRGQICAGCGQPMLAGQVPAIVNPEPPEGDDQVKAEAGRAHTVEAHIAHEACANAAMARKTAELQAEVEEYHQLVIKLGDLLTGVAKALKGPPDAVTTHDWSDLPRLAEQTMLSFSELWAVLPATEVAALPEPVRAFAQRVHEIVDHGE